jgi:hypothetical protein
LRRARFLEQILRSIGSPDKPGTLIAKEGAEYSTTKLRRKVKDMKTVRRDIHVDKQLEC